MLCCLVLYLVWQTVKRLLLLFQNAGQIHVVFSLVGRCGTSQRLVLGRCIRLAEIPWLICKVHGLMLGHHLSVSHLHSHSKFGGICPACVQIGGHTEDWVFLVIFLFV